MAFARPIQGTTVRVTKGPHTGKVGTVKTHNVEVGIVHVLVDGFGSGSEILHLPTEYVELVENKT